MTIQKQVSVDGRWYYLKNGETVPTGWLSLSGEPDKDGMDWLPFAFWGVWSGVVNDATPDEITRYEARNAPLSRPRQGTTVAMEEPRYLDVFARFIDATLNEARRQGWKIEDLNDNGHGAKVRGPAWKVTRPGTEPQYYWDKAKVALVIAPDLLIASNV